MSLFYKLYTLLFLNIIDNQVSLRCSKSSIKSKIIKIIHKMRRNKKSCKVRTSVSAFNLLGAVTVEAAMAVTIFMMSILSVISVLQAVHTYQAVHQALINTGNEAAVLGEEVQGAAGVYVLFAQKVKSAHIEYSGIVGGSGGISLFGSTINKNEGLIELNAVYKIKPPLLMFPGISLKFRHHMIFSIWNGYHPKNDTANDGDFQNTYFIAENESVYHTSAQCTHLRLSISAVSSQDVGSMRNSSGHKYDACLKCAEVAGKSVVYMTSDGTKFHTSLSCSGLKRTVYAVHEVDGLRKCSRCGKGGE